MSKKCKECGCINENPLLKYCMRHAYLNKKPKQTRVKQVSNKRTQRLKEYSEKDMFLEIWNERPHICDICKENIPEAKTYCFAHICPKGTYPEHRLKKDNISLVCSIKCHQKVDENFSGIQRQEHIRKLEALD